MSYENLTYVYTRDMSGKSNIADAPFTLFLLDENTTSEISFES